MARSYHWMPTIVVVGGPAILAFLLRGHWFIIFLTGVAVGAAYFAVVFSSPEKQSKPSPSVRDRRRMYLGAAAFAAICEVRLLWMAFVKVDLDRLGPYLASSMAFVPGVLLSVIGFLVWSGRSLLAKTR